MGFFDNLLEVVGDVAKSVSEKMEDSTLSFINTTERMVKKNYSEGLITKKEYFNQLKNVIFNREDTSKKRYVSGKMNEFEYKAEMDKCRALIMLLIDEKFSDNFKRSDYKRRYEEIHKNAVKDTSKNYYQNLSNLSI